MENTSRAFGKLGHARQLLESRTILMTPMCMHPADKDSWFSSAHPIHHPLPAKKNQIETPQFLFFFSFLLFLLPAATFQPRTGEKKSTQQKISFGWSHVPHPEPS